MRPHARFPLLALALLLVSVPFTGCSKKSSGPTAPVVITDVYVDAGAGSDSLAGSRDQPYRTITHALAAADSGVVIHVAPGRYDTTMGEHFPLVMKARQTLVGDTLSRGAGGTPTFVYGYGPVPAGITNAYTTTLVGAPGAVVTGLQLGAPGYGQHFEISARDADMTIARNTFTSTSFGAVLLEYARRSIVRSNVADCVTYGVRLYLCTDSVDVVDNAFTGMSIGVDVFASPGHTRVSGNQFTNNDYTCVMVQRGTPRVEQNTFQHAGTGPTYGAVDIIFNEASPILRGNHFQCGLGVNNLSGAPDLGTATDAGNNDFSAVTGAAIQHAGTAAILAIGNTWAHDPPRAGTEVVFTSTGTVRYGTGTGQILP